MSEISMSDRTNDDKMIENHLHTMVFETKINEGTQQEITLEHTKKTRVSKFDENISFEDQKIQGVDKRTIEDQHGVRSHFLISEPVQQTYINDYAYVNADGSFMTEEEKKKFEDDWKNHWAPEMTEDKMEHEIKTVCENVFEETEKEVTLYEEKNIRNEVYRSIKDHYSQIFYCRIVSGYYKNGHDMTEEEKEDFEDDWENYWTPKMTEDNKKEI